MCMARGFPDTIIVEPAVLLIHFRLPQCHSAIKTFAAFGTPNWTIGFQINGNWDILLILNQQPK